MHQRRLFDHHFLDRVNIERVVVNGSRHYSTPEGRVYPSVTTVLSSMSAKGIAEWKERIGSEQASKVLAQASRRGTAVHSLCEKYLLNEENYIRGAMPSNVSLFKQIQPYMDKYIGKVYGIEIPLYSDELKSAGTCDLFCQLHGINAVVDFKTSAHAKEEKYIENYFFQATAYAIMLEERYKISVPSIGLLVAVEDDNLQVFLKHTSEFRKKVVSHFKNYSCINSLDSL